MNLKDLNFSKIIELITDTANIEAEFYLLDNKLLKIFKSKINFERLQNKEKVIDYFLSNNIELKEVPKVYEKLFLNDLFQGYSLEYFPRNINCSKILNSTKEELAFKISLLKQIYTLIEKLEKINIYLNDIHEQNFIWNLDDDLVKAIDIDSFYVPDSNPQPSLYLSSNKDLYKYPHKYNSHNLIITPNHNTNIYAFILILLNTLSGYKMSRWNYNEIAMYLNILEDLNVNKKLLMAINNLNSYNDNYFDISLLDTIDSKKDYSLKKFFHSSL